MNFKSVRFLISTCVFTIITHINLAQGAGYTITDLGTLGGSSSSAIDINEAKQVTGYSYTTAGSRHAFYYDGSTMHDIGALDEDYSYSDGRGINDNGHITGLSYSRETTDGDYHAFLYDGTNLQDIETLGGRTSHGQDINNSDQVVGYSRISEDGPFHAFPYDDGTMRDIGTLGGTYSYAYGINNNGLVSGWADISNNTALHAFIYNSVTDTMHDIGTLGGSQSIGNRVNGLGQVTGWSNISTDSSDQHAFFYDGATMHDIGTLGGTNSRGLDINNSGKIVGSSYLANGYGAAFLYDGVNMLNLCEITACLSRGWTSLETASGINDNGDITGTGTINGEGHAFLISWNDQPEPEICTDTIDNDEDGFTDCQDTSDCGQHPMCYKPPGMAFNLIDLGTLGGTNSYAQSINNTGQVSGYSDITGDTQENAFFYDASSMIDVGTLGYPDSYGNSINDDGDIVGNLHIGDDAFYNIPLFHAFIDQGSGMLDLHSSLSGPCGINPSHAYDINNTGQIAGACTIAIADVFYGTYGHAIVYDGNTTLDLGLLTGVPSILNSEAYGINNNGQVTGEYNINDWYTHAFLYDGSAMHDLGTLGGNESSGKDINDIGHVAGWSNRADGLTRAFLYDGDTLQDLDTLGGSGSYAYGINNSDQVVGYSRLTSGENAAFLYHEDRMLYLCRLTDCNSRGWYELRRAADINDRGDITGYGVINGETHAFLAITMSVDDTDDDGVADSSDNCTLVSNPAQRDTDSDGYGNYCDPDFDNNIIVGASDLAFFKPRFFTDDPDADLNGDGVVMAADLAILKAMFFKPPGPSGLVP